MARFMIVTAVIFILFVTTHANPLQQYTTSYGLTVPWQIDVPSIIGTTSMAESQSSNGESFKTNTHFLVPQRIYDHNVFDRFVDYKKVYGSISEKDYYANKMGGDIIKKCIDKRAVSFFDKWDFTLLRDTNSYAFHLNWTLIGDDAWERSDDNAKREMIMKYLRAIKDNNDQGIKPIDAKIDNWEYSKPDVIQIDKLKEEHFVNIIKYFKIENYLSYDEMLLCATLTVAGPTQFYNNGNRGNKGQIPAGYPIKGYIAGAVGPRFELPKKMEHGLMIDPTPLKSMADIIFEGVDDVYQDWDGKSVNIAFLKARYRMAYQPYLRWGLSTLLNNHPQKKGYFSITGLGAGVWAIDNKNQSKLIVDVVMHIIGQDWAGAPAGTVVDFTYFPFIDYNIAEMTEHRFKEPFGEGKGKMMDASFQHKQHTQITIKFTVNDPSSIDKMQDGYQIFELYAYDSNSAPGNEVHVLGSKNIPNATNNWWLIASGDPAAAVSSDIMWTQSAVTNEHLTNHYKMFQDANGQHVTETLPGGQRRSLAEANKAGQAFQIFVMSAIAIGTLLMSYFFFYNR